MRFLRRSTTDSATTDTETPGDEAVEVQAKSYTPGKGKATPKRREAEAKRRGPVAPPPTTMREAMKRNKELRKSAKADPEYKLKQRNAAKERRERMMAGEDKYLLPRDRGPVKAYIRDLVDSRRNLLGLFMPLAILVFVALILPYPEVQRYATLLCTVMLLGMIVEGFLSGRRIAKMVRLKFPNETIKGTSVGWYSFIRASQIRKLRVPKPRVKPGDKV
ncbi:DUF3043 domain-containing protein [Amycolatopsis sp. TRM77291]|uniref:DUF3043 domain-containing protein n=1 Tax=Amycolatopsis roodepoortensis TaxID=700274 RepID=A0ABR9KYN3_9PSEU|nr:MULTISPECIES: DUF3043 domain-containing protein [Amycolatopsis]MBE1573221.1 hypothetical protein [Amycolatopsis roodepoortensis]QXV62697.1 DUF3043 domain-containing protein [Amycolatopsis sp. TNS106]RSN18165.1 DUF3043 domain-containing protein [Streptomyces sp. WAC 05977]